MNKRRCECKITSYIAVGQEGSIVDLETKAEKCLSCDFTVENCEYKYNNINLLKNENNR